MNTVGDYILEKEFNNRGEAEEFERQNLEKLKKVSNYPVGGWEIVEITKVEDQIDLMF